MTTKKSQKASTKQKNRIRQIVLVEVVVLVGIVVVVSVVNLSGMSISDSKRLHTLEARTERLEFCVAKQISPCSYEKLAEWNTNHPEPTDQFRPRVDDGFYEVQIR